MEQKYSGPIDKVFALLTDPKWLEACSAALGELSAKVTAEKGAGGITLSMKRRVKRDLPGIASWPPSLARAAALPGEQPLALTTFHPGDHHGTT